MTKAPFVPTDFEPPTSLFTDRFRLEPLGPQHNAHLDQPLVDAVAQWVGEAWPWERVLYR